MEPKTMGIVEQVREGLEAKIEGIQVALQYVRDPREIERLSAELLSAGKALDKINEPDTRSQEEIEKIANMVNVEADFESAPQTPWTSLSDSEKLKYQMELYFSKLEESLADSTEKRDELSKVLSVLSFIDLDNHTCILPIYQNIEQSVKELDYSISAIESQMALKDEAIKAVDRAFSEFDVVNRFLNNPMSLPHLTEQKSAELEALRNGDSIKC